MAQLACIHPAGVGMYWSNVADLVRCAMERGRMGRFADVEADVLGGNAYLWFALKSGAEIAVAVTKVTVEDDGRLCTIVACASRGRDDWIWFGALIKGLEEYARAEGCRAIEICGRPGWSRRLKDYRLVKAVIRKNI